MTRHDTPDNVASVLAGWAPRGMRTVLEPAVGSGALLAPLVHRFKKQLRRVVAIDVDATALSHVKGQFDGTLKSALSTHLGDFLQWDGASSARNRGFDCVIMNPPFAGRMNALIAVPLLKHDKCRRGVRHAPLEGAFLLKASQMLNDGGRLLAIVPGSIVSGDSGQWIREELLRRGRIVCVHELPRFTFPNVEAKVYLFIYERSLRRAKITLCNHRLIDPDRLLVAKDELGHGLRLDYDFHASLRWYEVLRAATPHAGWEKLGNVANVLRGKAESPDGINKAVHTVDFLDGFWRSDRLRDNGRRIRKEVKGLRSSDLLMSRVGRGCVSSVGPIVGSSGLGWTDCLFCIRPQQNVAKSRIALAMRVLFSFDEGRTLVQRGSGATYVTERALTELMIPLKLADKYPEHFMRYERAIQLRDGNQIVAVEKELKAKLRRAVARVAR